MGPVTAEVKAAASSMQKTNIKERPSDQQGGLFIFEVVK